ncbi:hypothetical protein HYW74_02500 [Candidatus Pacearchaeota archaeon]|nr:hypothetical protein [Candidatus Pacearchaeota archaeon]
MEEIRQTYQTISDYITNSNFLNVASGVMVVGGLFFLGHSIKLWYDIRNIERKKEDKGLEKKL